MTTAVITAYAGPHIAHPSSFETVCLFCAAGLALSAALVSVLPSEAIVWALTNIG
jgi:hypothetical protein